MNCLSSPAPRCCCSSSQRPVWSTPSPLPSSNPSSQSQRVRTSSRYVQQRRQQLHNNNNTANAFPSLIRLQTNAIAPGVSKCSRTCQQRERRRGSRGRGRVSRRCPTTQCQCPAAGQHGASCRHPSGLHDQRATDGLLPEHATTSAAEPSWRPVSWHPCHRENVAAAPANLLTILPPQEIETSSCLVLLCFFVSVACRGSLAKKAYTTTAVTPSIRKKKGQSPLRITGTLRHRFMFDSLLFSLRFFSFLFLLSL